LSKLAPNLTLNSSVSVGRHSRNTGSAYRFLPAKTPTARVTTVRRLAALYLGSTNSSSGTITVGGTAELWARRLEIWTLSMPYALQAVRPLGEAHRRWQRRWIFRTVTLGSSTSTINIGSGSDMHFAGIPDRVRPVRHGLYFIRWHWSSDLNRHRHQSTSMPRTTRDRLRKSAALPPVRFLQRHGGYIIVANVGLRRLHDLQWRTC